MYGLKDSVVKQIKKIFSEFPEIEEVILYGSRAKGNFKPGSDIDLTLKGVGLNLKILNRIDRKIDDLLLAYTFDISIYDNIEDSDLLDHIKRGGRIFYRKSLK